ncbi:ataxin-3-like isoform X2 [Oppia nitens]|uniref:ataxin-3-like isoform X2 n=1 Tax=Oppia nitens TaxID=1686743 RepID=UPI0023DCA977|nr:ataxin-3-like isoform X2 [Oppia nitens]
METIFHEKQEGLLCAQHCLNALLQGEYFTAVDLAQLAQQIDEQERHQMAEGGENREEYRRFIQSPSDNMDDSGFFSVQVIASALRVWSLDLIAFNSTCDVAIAAQTDPTRQKAYICNYREHWFTVRKIGRQWFNLNSLLSGPELISDTYLSLFLAQLQTEGYAIFIVSGILPSCTADTALADRLVTQLEKPRLLTEPSKTKSKTNKNNEIIGNEDEDKQMIAAMKMSIEYNEETERKQLEAALALSLEPTSSTTNNSSQMMSEEEMLDTAIKMSLQAL